jgi:hypothetical protein
MTPNKDFFMMFSEVKVKNFKTLVHNVSLNTDKSVMKTTETLWKNNLIKAKYA